MVSRSDAYKAASEKKKPVSLEILCNFCRENGGATPIDQRCNTILHFLAIHGNTDAIRRLLTQGLLTSEQLKKCNANGDTALHEAARFGHKDVAKMMLEKEGDLIIARNILGETPIYLAAAFGNTDVFNFLRTKISDECLMRLRTEDGSTVLHAAVNGENYGLALSILEKYPNLADKREEKGMTALNLLASKPKSFRSGSSYVFTNLGTTSFIPWQILEILVYLCIPSKTTDWETAGDVEDQRDSVPTSSKLKWLSKLISACTWTKAIDDVKQKHGFARILAKRLIEKENDWIDYPNCENILLASALPLQKKNRVPNPLIEATKNHVVEMVEEILEKFPDAATTFDENGKNILHIAAQQKDIILYDYLKKTVNHADRMMADVDNHGNTILHHAAYKDYPALTIFGPAIHMTWEVFCFKRVENDTHPHLLYHRNSDGKTAKELFEENHSEVRKEAEKTAKEMNSGLMLVSTLIGTVNYAALFTIPGGFDQDKGLPLFFTKAKTGQQDLKLFVFYVGGSLFASLLGLGTQLSIQLSRFGSNDFLISLPLKFLIATTSLFYATGFSLTTCFQAYILENAFLKSSFVTMWVPCILMSLVYIDVIYPAFGYMYDVLHYSFAYRSKKMLFATSLVFLLSQWLYLCVV